MPIWLGRFLNFLDIIVYEHIAAPVILGTDYCDRLVEENRPRKVRLIERWSTVPVFNNLSSRPLIEPKFTLRRAGRRRWTRVTHNEGIRNGSDPSAYPNVGYGNSETLRSGNHQPKPRFYTNRKLK